MICYSDRTFCISKDCKCGRELTKEIEDAAVKWWGSKDAPIAVACFCGEPKDEYKHLVETHLNKRRL